MAPPLELIMATSWLNLNDIRKPNGSLGNQGFTADGINNLTNHIYGTNIPVDNSIKNTLEQVRQQPNYTQKMMQFLTKTPVSVGATPDGPHLQDGHHRAFLADQLGFKRIPTAGQDNTLKVGKAMAQPMLGTPAPTVFTGELPPVQEINPPSIAQQTAQMVNNQSAKNRMQRTLSGTLPPSPAQIVDPAQAYRPKMNAWDNFAKFGNKMNMMTAPMQIRDVAQGLQDIKNRGGGWLTPAQPQIPKGYE